MRDSTVQLDVNVERATTLIDWLDDFFEVMLRPPCVFYGELSEQLRRCVAIVSVAAEVFEKCRHNDRGLEPELARAIARLSAEIRCSADVEADTSVSIARTGQPDHVDLAEESIEVLAEYFDTLGCDTYASLPPSMHALIAGFDSVSSEIRRCRETNIELDVGSIDWLISRVEELASESRSEPTMTPTEREVLFSRGLVVTETPTLSRGLI